MQEGRPDDRLHGKHYNYSEQYYIKEIEEMRRLLA